MKVITYRATFVVEDDEDPTEHWNTLGTAMETFDYSMYGLEVDQTVENFDHPDPEDTNDMLEWQAVADGLAKQISVGLEERRMVVAKAMSTMLELVTKDPDRLKSLEMGCFISQTPDGKYFSVIDPEPTTRELAYWNLMAQYDKLKEYVK